MMHRHLCFAATLMTMLAHPYQMQWGKTQLLLQYTLNCLAHAKEDVLPEGEEVKVQNTRGAIMWGVVLQAFS